MEISLERHALGTKRPQPELKQMQDIMEFLLTYDSAAFPDNAHVILEELRVRTQAIDKLEEQNSCLDPSLDPRMKQILLFTESLQAWKLIDQLQGMWYKHYGDEAVHILDYIKRITCEISLVRIDMVHPIGPIGEKDCCIFDIDDTLYHNDVGCLALARGIIPEFISWILELQRKGYSIILLTARTEPHPHVENQLAMHGIVVHRYICAPLSTYLPYSNSRALYERAKIAKQRARLQLKAEGYNICLTVGNLVGDVEDDFNRYLLPLRCSPSQKQTSQQTSPRTI